MTNEQILEELRKLKARTSKPTSGELKNIDEEVAEIDESIADYRERIAELEAKIADTNNYSYNGDNEERDLTVELLQESFENQLESIKREEIEYKNLQELAKEIYVDYNEEIEGLNTEIAAIERKLRKNEIAVRKNIGIKLTEQELADLEVELAGKKERIARCEQMKNVYVQDLQNYDELITTSNHKKEIVLNKQAHLNKIVEDRKNNIWTVDKHKLRLDNDELFRLKSGLAALEARKEYITYNPNEEIDKLIAAISASKGINESELNEEKDNTIVLPPITPQLNNEEGTPASNEAEDQKDDDLDCTALITHPSVIDVPREAEIEDAKEELKEKKKDKKFVALWKKFSKKAKVITAAAIAAGIIIITRSCGVDAPVNTDVNNTNTISYTQTMDENKIENTDENFETYTPMEDTVISNEDQNIAEPTVDTNVTPDVPVAPVTPETPDVPDNPVIPDEPDVPVETESVKLDQGEAVISFDDIVNKTINEDTVISHGDEVGKTTDGATLTNYDENGQAEVEMEKTTDENTTSTTSKTPEEIKKALEEFMGGEITFDHDDNQWLDEIQNGKTR